MPYPLHKKREGIAYLCSLGPPNRSCGKYGNCLRWRATSAEDAYGENLENAFALEDDCIRVIFRSEDAQEGPRTFMERHAPHFIGRSCR